jgi:hypothetical protein
MLEFNYLVGTIVGDENVKEMHVIIQFSKWVKSSLKLFAL